MIHEKFLTIMIRLGFLHTMNHFEFSDLKPGAHIHFIGIGGISMSGLAQILLQAGYRVTGSDRARTHITEKLEQLGAVIHYGHAAENVSGADLIVHTAAVHDDNPEMIAAKTQHIRLIDRAECLGAIMRRYKNAVGVAGTHGKTTTTSMLAHAMVHAGVDPTISIGGELDLIDGNIRTGSSDYFVTEACEYTNSFLKFFPSIALITNIEADHLDFFSGLEEIIESFRKFALLTKDGGHVVAWGGDANIRKALDGTGLHILYYGIGPGFDYYSENCTYGNGFPAFDVMRAGAKLCHIQLNVPGEHNILNALAAIAVCDLLGIAPSIAAAGIETFHGTHRRFEKKGTFNGAAVIDDYAHHPTEIQATLKAAQNLPHNKLWCVFQPHTYTRTKTLWNDFKTCFRLADELILTDIYAAREQFDGVTTAENLAADICSAGINAVYMKTFAEIEAYLRARVQPGDVVFTMGAGDVFQIGNHLLGIKKDA